MRVDAESMPVVEMGGEIKVFLFIEDFEPVGPNHGKNHFLGVFVADGGKLQIDQLSIPSQYRGHPHIDV